MPAVENFPDPPRRPRAGAYPISVWAMGLLTAGLLLGVLIAVVTLLSTGAELFPFRDDALDERGFRAFGEITGCQPLDPPPTETERVSYRAAAAGVEVRGSMPVPARRYSPGDRVTVEFLPDKASVNRLQGERISAGVGLLGYLLFPTVIVALLFLRLQVRNRTLLRDGQAGKASVLDSEANLQTAKGPILTVRYRLAGVGDSTIEAKQFVTAKSTLGRAVRTGALHLPVVYDPIEPDSRSLLVDAEQFLPADPGRRTQSL